MTTNADPIKSLLNTKATPELVTCLHGTVAQLNIEKGRKDRNVSEIQALQLVRRSILEVIEERHPVINARLDAWAEDLDTNMSYEEAVELFLTTEGCI